MRRTRGRGHGRGAAHRRQRHDDALAQNPAAVQGTLRRDDLPRAQGRRHRQAALQLRGLRPQRRPRRRRGTGLELPRKPPRCTSDTYPRPKTSLYSRNIYRRVRLFYSIYHIPSRFGNDFRRKSSHFPNDFPK